MRWADPIDYVRLHVDCMVSVEEFGL